MPASRTGGDLVSAFVAYDPALLSVRRITEQSAQLRVFMVGRSRLGAIQTTSVPIPLATVSITSGYSPNENGTLLVDPETATVSLSFWDQPGVLLYPGDRLDVRYANKLIFSGTVDSTTLTYSTDPEALPRGKYRRIDFTATAAGVYAVVMGRTVTWKALPKEKAIDRIRRWVTVRGYDSLLG
jgi:hypothetical protein